VEWTERGVDALHERMAARDPGLGNALKTCPSEDGGQKSSNEEAKGHRKLKDVRLACSAEGSPPIVYSNDGFVEDYGGVVWPCTELLCSVLSEELVGGKNVLELGAGCGVVGMYALRLRPHALVLTDLPQTTMRVTRPTVDANAKSIRESGCCVAVVPYRWGEDDWKVIVQASTCSNEDVDVILCSDVMYDWKLYDPFVRSLEQLALCHSDPAACICLLAFEERPSVRRDDVLGLLRLMFTVTVVRSARTRQSKIDDLHVFRLQLKQDPAQRVDRQAFLEEYRYACGVCTLENEALAPACIACASKRPNPLFPVQPLSER
jgi:predicted nicotinamide N-methyase